MPQHAFNFDLCTWSTCQIVLSAPIIHPFHVGSACLWHLCFHIPSISSLLFVTSICPDCTCVHTLCSWGRCGWWSHAGRWHAPTCSALTPHSTSRWTRRSQPGCVLSVTRRPPMNTSSSTGKSPKAPPPIIWSQKAGKLSKSIKSEQVNKIGHLIFSWYGTKPESKLLQGIRKCF